MDTFFFCFHKLARNYAVLALNFSLVEEAVSKPSFRSNHGPGHELPGYVDCAFHTSASV